jgi:phospholipid/cholesterol/gamma-HCH transport system substrate-binding protein
VDTKASEIKTGIFVLIALIFLIWLLFSIGGSSRMLRAQKEYKILYKSIAGLKEDSSVRFEGFEVGNVRQIKILPAAATGPETIEVMVRVDSSTPIKDDSVFEIKTEGFLGTKYIDILAGSRDNKLATSGRVFEGSYPRDMNTIIERVSVLLDKAEPQLANIVQSTDELLGDTGSLRKSLHSLELAMGDVAGILQSRRGDIEGVLENLNQTSANMRDFSRTLKEHPWRLIWQTAEEKREMAKERRKKAQEEQEQKRKESQKETQDKNKDQQK